MTTIELPALVRRLATRSPAAEANKQADIQTLLLYGGLSLDEGDLEIVELEAQVGGGRRIEAETLAAETDVSGKRTFQAQRRLVREALEREGIAQAIDTIVLRLLAAK